MQANINKNNSVSVFRKTVKKTEKGIHVGFVGDFDNCIGARISIYVWSRLKRKTRPEKLNDFIFSNGVRS